MPPPRDPEPDVVVFGAPPGGRPRRGRLRAVGLPLVLAAVVVAALVVRATSGSGTSAGPSPHPSPTAASPSPLPQPVGSSDGPQVTEAGRPLLGVTAGWELFGFGPASVVRIELARGRMTTTVLPPVGSSGPVSFIAGPGGAIVRPLDAVPGYLVPDGKPAQDLPGPLDHAGPVLPGPDPAHVWAPRLVGDQTVGMDLVGFDGRPAGRYIPFPAGAGGYADPDGAGYLVAYAPGGAYDLRPDSVRRITTGQLLAVGPTRWLAVDCDEQLRCWNVVIDKDTWAQHVLDRATGATSGPAGVISPDGARAALVVRDQQGRVELHLIQLSNGARRVVDAYPPSQDGGTLAWSPDSRWLFMVDGSSHLRVIEAATGNARDLGARLPVPVLSQVAVRAAP